MREAFRALLTSATEITSLVPVDRINFWKHPQGAALPGIVLNVVSDGPYDHSLDGAGIRDGRVQVDVYAKHYGTGVEIADAVEERLDSYSGGPFQMIALITRPDTAEEVPTESPVYRSSMDFLVRYSR
jgi:hypothetical protein